jgi:nicotinamidase-related amidase
MWMYEKPVLISIDMQKAFDLPGRPRRWNGDLDANGLALLLAWRSRNLPIIHVRNDSIDPGPAFFPAALETLSARASSQGRGERGGVWRALRFRRDF